MKFNIDMIEAILVNEDIEGLIKIGAPIDEYSYEAKLIHSRLSNENVTSVMQIVNKVFGVFTETFCSSSSTRDDLDSFRISASGLKIYSENKLNKIKNIAQLIYNCSKEE